MALKKLQLSTLVEDLTLYPRNRVDDTHVNDLVRALEAGTAMPPIVADTNGRIVDGVHRRRAILRHVGPDAKASVDVRSYKDDAALFVDAVALNSQHGRKLDRHDQSRIVLKMRELGVPDAEIAVSLHVPTQQVQTLAVRVVYAPSGDAIPSKRGLRHMLGRTVTDEQVAVIQSVRSGEAGRLCLELTRLLETGLVDLTDDAIVERLRSLSRSIEKSLRLIAA